MSVLGMLVSGGITVRPALYIRTLTGEFLKVVAFSGGVGMRLLGISIASFSSGPLDCASSRLWLKMTVA